MVGSQIFNLQQPSTGTVLFNAGQKYSSGSGSFRMDPGELHYSRKKVKTEPSLL